MLTEARRVSVRADYYANDLMHRRVITKEQYGLLKRSPKAAQKIDLYTVVPEVVRGWTKYAREVSLYDSEAEYASDIAAEYTVKQVMRGGKNAL